MKVLLFVLLIFGLALFLFLLIQANPMKTEVCFQDNCFLVAIADSPAERKQGLKFRKELSQDGGMLFVFEKQGFYSFWMKDTFIALDIIWLNKDREVVYIKHNAQPCIQEPCEKFKSETPAQYVLELRAGKAEEIGLGVGNKLKFGL